VFERIKAIRRKPDFEKDADINEVLVEALLRIMEATGGAASI
jgi:hypothetical protein